MYSSPMGPGGINVIGSRRIQPTSPTTLPLHRIAEVMGQEQINPRTIATRIGMTVSEVSAKSRPSQDMALSELYQWQKALQVPLIDLLIEPGLELSMPVKLRGELIKAMRTARSILEQTEMRAVELLAVQLVQHFLQAMPELIDVPPWPSVGQRRCANEFGAILDNSIPDQFFELDPRKH